MRGDPVEGHPLEPAVSQKQSHVMDWGTRGDGELGCEDQTAANVRGRIDPHRGDGGLGRAVGRSLSEHIHRRKYRKDYDHDQPDAPLPYVVRARKEPDDGVGLSRMERRPWPQHVSVRGGDLTGACTYIQAAQYVLAALRHEACQGMPKRISSLGTSEHGSRRATGYRWVGVSSVWKATVAVPQPTA